jgi:hypothetical protein
MDRRILSTIVDKFEGGPVGLDTIAASVGEEKETLEDVYEPFLLQAGLIMRTPRGRVAAPGAYDHLGLEIPTQLLSALSLGDPDYSQATSPRGSARSGAIQDALFAPERDEDACTEEPGLED